MALALTRALLTHDDRRFDPHCVVESYRLWYEGPTFRGAGQTTRKALDSLKHGMRMAMVGALCGAYCGLGRHTRKLYYAT